MGSYDEGKGFFMENETGKITGFCPLFDHDHAFSDYPAILSQTTSETMTLFAAAAAAQRELCLDLEGLSGMQCPDSLTEKQWEKLLERKDKLERI